MTARQADSGRRSRRQIPARIFFTDAVPLHADRRELRRRLRSAARRLRREQKRQVTAAMVDLAVGHVRVNSMTKATLGSELVEFADGTRLLLDVRDGSTILGNLAERTSTSGVYLGRVEACFGFGWYQLRFCTDADTGVAVLARVRQFESATMSFRRGSRWRWRHRQVDQSQS